MAYASSPVTGSYLGNLVAEALSTLIFRKWAGGLEPEPEIRNKYIYFFNSAVPAVHPLLAVINKS